MKTFKYILSLVLTAAFVFACMVLPSLAFAYAPEQNKPPLFPDETLSPSPTNPLKKLSVAERVSVLAEAFGNSQEIEVSTRLINTSGIEQNPSGEAFLALEFSARQVEDTFVQFGGEAFVENIVKHSVLSEIEFAALESEPFSVYSVQFDSAEYDDNLPSLSFELYLDRETGLVLFIEFLYTYAKPKIGGSPNLGDFYTSEEEIQQFAASWGVYLGLPLEQLSGTAASGEFIAIYSSGDLRVKYGLSFLNYTDRFYQARIIPIR